MEAGNNFTTILDGCIMVCTLSLLQYAVTGFFACITDMCRSHFGVSHFWLYSMLALSFAWFGCQRHSSFTWLSFIFFSLSIFCMNSCFIDDCALCQTDGSSARTSASWIALCGAWRIGPVDRCDISVQKNYITRTVFCVNVVDDVIENVHIRIICCLWCRRRSLSLYASHLLPTWHWIRRNIAASSLMYRVIDWGSVSWL